MTTHFSEELLSVDVVATALDCAGTTVEERARAGELPGIKLGRSWIFPRAALLQSLNEMALREASRSKDKPAKPAVAIVRTGKRQAAPRLPQLST